MRWVAVLAMLLTFSAWAQQPSPSRLPQPAIAGQPDHKSEEPKQQPASEQGITDQELPFIVKMVEGKQAQDKANPSASQSPKESPEATGWSLSDKIAAGAAIAAFLQFIALIWTIGVMRNSAQRQLRAYIALGDPNFGSAEPTKIIIPVENGGQTPAYKVWGHINRRWVPYGERLSEDYDFPDLGEAGSGKSIAVINPGAMKKFTFPIDTAELKAVRNNETALFIYGHIDYIDAFGKKRYSRFNYQYFAAVSEDGRHGHALLMQSTHNEAT